MNDSTSTTSDRGDRSSWDVHVHASSRSRKQLRSPTEAVSVLADHIINADPSCEKVRLVNSGTEAMLSAIHHAKVIKFGGNSKGHVHSLLVLAGGSAAILGVVHIATFKVHSGQIAAVIVEPVVASLLNSVIIKLQFISYSANRVKRGAWLLNSVPKLQ